MSTQATFPSWLPIALVFPYRKLTFAVFNFIFWRCISDVFPQLQTFRSGPFTVHESCRRQEKHQRFCSGSRTKARGLYSKYERPCRGAVAGARAGVRLACAQQGSNTSKLRHRSPLSFTPCIGWTDIAAITGRQGDVLSKGGLTASSKTQSVIGPRPHQHLHAPRP